MSPRVSGGRDETPFEMASEFRVLIFAQKLEFIGCEREI
jgi:hypothetical protein